VETTQPKNKRAESRVPVFRLGKKIDMGDCQIRTNWGEIIYKARRVKYAVKVENCPDLYLI